MLRNLSLATFLIACPACTCGGTHPAEAEVPRASEPPVEAAHDAASHPAQNVVRAGVEAYPVRHFSYALADVNVSIEDAGMRPSLAPMLERPDALLAVNGGFFDSNGKALGLAISQGHSLAPFAPRLSGGVFGIEGERGWLSETESFVAPSKVDFAVQCRPRLVVDGKVNIRSDDGKRAERTAICLREHGTVLDFFIVRSDQTDHMLGPSLFALAQHLAEFGCEEALNLDGGPSTGAAFWQDGKVQHLPPRGPIRHAIVVRARQGRMNDASTLGVEN
ncbi:phosphodiester glycosidase family protein [Pendulispora rubella]|uniref:Phosphodiester glycosidase family protein n=1 Tax=Pendulispora rubella TaxID=2741070 RepID=A0ABZ2L1Z2_9BACT